MPRRLFTTVAAACAAVVGTSAPVFAQGWFGDPCCPPPAAFCPPPVCACAPCAQACAPPLQAVQQPVFQQVAMTEFRPERQTVQKPVVEMVMVDEPCTEYRQVCENRTAQVPTVQYQTVCENRVVQRDMGRWVTQYHCNPRMSPCDYDGRPDLFGFMNRAGYQARMAFTPPMTATRHYVPNIVAQTIPVQRTVAIPSTRTVSYQVSRTVPYQTTRRVGKQTVRYVTEEIVVQKPHTVYKTVQVGTQTVFATPTFGGGAATVLNPIPDGSIQAVRPRGERSAANPGPQREAKAPSSLNSDADDIRSRTNGALAPQPYERNTEQKSEVTRGKVDEPYVATNTLSIVRVGRWVSRQSSLGDTPRLPRSEMNQIAVAENDK